MGPEDFKFSAEDQTIPDKNIDLSGDSGEAPSEVEANPVEQATVDSTKAFEADLTKDRDTFMEAREEETAESVEQSPIMNKLDARLEETAAQNAQVVLGTEVGEAAAAHILDPENTSGIEVEKHDPEADRQRLENLINSNGSPEEIEKASNAVDASESLERLSELNTQIFEAKENHDEVTVEILNKERDTELEKITQRSTEREAERAKHQEGVEESERVPIKEAAFDPSPARKLDVQEELDENTESQESRADTPPNLHVVPDVKPPENEKLDQNQSEQPKTIPAEQQAGLEGPFPGFTGHISENVREKFGRLASSAKLAIEGLYARAKFNTVDRLQILHSEKFIEAHSWRAQKRKDKLDGYDAEIVRLQRQMGRGPSVAARLGIKETPAMQQEREKVRQESTRKIEKLEGKRDVAQTKIKQMNNQMSVYENARNEVAKGFQESVSEQLKPLERKMEGLQSQKEQLDTEINGMSERGEKYDARINDFEKMLSDEFLLPEERKVVKETIKETKEERKVTNKLVRGRISDRVRIEKRMIPVERKLDNWRDRESTAARITNREVPYKDIGIRRRAQINEARAEISIGATSTSEMGSEDQSERSLEKEPQMSIENFASSWNKYFGSEIPVDTKLFCQAAGYKANEASEVTLSNDEIERNMTEYVQLLRVNKMNKKGNISQKQLDKNLKLFWNYTRLEN